MNHPKKAGTVVPASNFQEKFAEKPTHTRFSRRNAHGHPRTGARPSAVDSGRHAGYRQHARPARSLRSLAAYGVPKGNIVTLRQVGSRACPAPSVARVGLRGVSILRVGALLLERGVAVVSQGVGWFGGALRAQRLSVALAAGVPPRPPKALTGLRSLRSRTAYGVPKGRGRYARTHLRLARLA